MFVDSYPIPVFFFSSVSVFCAVIIGDRSYSPVRANYS
jgi:hypothetical protein